MLARRSSSGHGGLLGVRAYHALLLPRARQSIMGIEARSSRDQPRLPLALCSRGLCQVGCPPPLHSRCPHRRWARSPRSPRRSPSRRRAPSRGIGLCRSSRRTSRLASSPPPLSQRTLAAAFSPVETVVIFLGAWPAGRDPTTTTTTHPPTHQQRAGAQPQPRARPRACGVARGGARGRGCRTGRLWYTSSPALTIQATATNASTKGKAKAARVQYRILSRMPGWTGLLAAVACACASQLLSPPKHRRASAAIPAAQVWQIPAGIPPADRIPCRPST